MVLPETNIVFKARSLYSDEQRLLRSLKSKSEKETEVRIKFCYYIIAALSGAGFARLAVFVQDSFWVLPFGTLAVLACSFIVFMPYEVYKGKKKKDERLKELNHFINEGGVCTCLVEAKRIAVAEEYEDEGDLYIIEYEFGKVLYLWNYDYTPKNFPCLVFEIYEDRFFKMFGRQVCMLSKPIKPVVISGKAKWNYLENMGVPGHLTTQNINFDKLIVDYNNYL
jgi:hypothetical protein